VYRIVAPGSPESAIDLTNFPGRPEVMNYSSPDGASRAGWFFPGLTSAPIIVLCPGYQTNRGEALPLAAAIQEHGYNVFLADIGGSGGKENSTLGFRETAELRAAMAAVSRRDDVDRSRFGLWGSDLGGYVALAVAESDPRVKAVTVESAYDQPQDLATVLINRQGMVALPLLGSFAGKGFYWLHYSERRTQPLSANLSRLAGVAKLFLATSDEPALALSTQRIYRMSPDPKEMVVLAHGQYSSLVDEEKRVYENRLVSFFLGNLPVERTHAAPAAPSLPAAPVTPKLTSTSAPDSIPAASVK
jgi:pimeloyl-ACP methyl ester carboxylesterase